MIVLYFLVYDQDNEKQKKFMNAMSFRDTVVSTGQRYKPLAEKHTSAIVFQMTSNRLHRIILQIIAKADFVNSALFILKSFADPNCFQRLLWEQQKKY